MKRKIALMRFFLSIYIFNEIYIYVYSMYTFIHFKAYYSIILITLIILINFNFIIYKYKY